MRSAYLLTILLIASSHATFIQSKTALGARSKETSSQKGDLEIWDEWVETVWRFDEATQTEEGYMFDFKSDSWLKYQEDDENRWNTVYDVPDWVEEGSDYATPAATTEIWRYDVQQIWAYDSYQEVEFGYMVDENTDQWLIFMEDDATDDIFWLAMQDESMVPDWVWEFEGEDKGDKDDGGDSGDGEWETWEEWAEQIWAYDNEEGTEHGYMHDWRSDQWMRYDPTGNWYPVTQDEVPDWVWEELGHDPNEKEIVLPGG